MRASSTPTATVATQNIPLATIVRRSWAARHRKQVLKLPPRTLKQRRHSSYVFVLIRGFVLSLAAMRCGACWSAPRSSSRSRRRLKTPCASAHQSRPANCCAILFHISVNCADARELGKLTGSTCVWCTRHLGRGAVLCCAVRPVCTLQSGAVVCSSLSDSGVQAGGDGGNDPGGGQGGDGHPGVVDA